MWDKYGDFLISDHESLLDDLNKISDGLLKAKWYFLAAISAIAFAYKFMIENLMQVSVFGKLPIVGPYVFSSASYNLDANNSILVILLICLVGNVILWLVSEYALSHGFLFRYVQGKVAQIESIFIDGNNILKVKASYKKFSRNPYDISKFIKGVDGGGQNRFAPDHIIPDQFVPLYWASIWLIVINSVLAYKMISFHIDTNPYLFSYLANIEESEYRFLF